MHPVDPRLALLPSLVDFAFIPDSLDKRLYIDIAITCML